MPREDVGEHVQLRLGDLGEGGLHERAVGHVGLHHQDGRLPVAGATVWMGATNMHIWIPLGIIGQIREGEWMKSVKSVKK